MAQTYTREEVSKHNTEDSVWFIIDAKVYDVSDFLDAHPGGEAVLRQVAGQDAGEAFWSLHRNEVLAKYEDLVIGTIKGEKSVVVTPKPGDLSEVPYAEPLWLAPAYKSPYYNDSHRRLQKAARIFHDEIMIPYAQARESDGKYIEQEFIEILSKKGILHMRLGPGKHLHGVDLLDGAVNGTEFNYFHDNKANDNHSRLIDPQPSGMYMMPT